MQAGLCYQQISDASKSLVQANLYYRKVYYGARKSVVPASLWQAYGGDVAQLVRASDRHAAEAGSIPRYR